MKKRIVFCLILTIIGAALSGCGNKYPSLSEQDNEMVAKYAAQLLLKYDRNYNNQSNIVDLSKVEEEPEEVITPEEPLPMESDNQIEIPEDDQYVDQSDVTVDGQKENKSLEEMLGLDQFRIEYQGYQICKSYPEGSDEQFYVALDAQQGHQLMVFHFNFINDSFDDQYVDIMSIYTRFRFYINDGTQNNSLTTMLSNDLSNFQGTFLSGESKDLVLIIEVSDETAEQPVNKLELMMKLQDESTLLLLE